MLSEMGCQPGQLGDLLEGHVKAKGTYGIVIHDKESFPFNPSM